MCYTPPHFPKNLSVFWKKRGGNVWCHPLSQGVAIGLKYNGPSGLKCIDPQSGRCLHSINNKQLNSPIPRLNIL